MGCRSGKGSFQLSGVNQGDLATAAETQGRAPEAGAGADVDPEAAFVLMQAFEIGLHQEDGIAEGPDLAGMGVAGKDQAAAFLKTVDGAWLMGHDEARFGVCGFRKSRSDVGSAAFVIESGKPQAAMGELNLEALIAEDAKAEALPMGDPFFGAGVVVVIAETEEDSVRRLESGERSDFLTEFLDAAVDHVASDADEIGLE